MAAGTVAPARTRKRSQFAKLFAVVLFFLSLVSGSSALAAGERAAIIYPNTSVSLNGAPITRATPVFPGDTVATGPEATATIISEGTQIALPGNAVVTFGEHSLTLIRNSAQVSTVNGFVAHTGPLTVAPDASSGAQFELKEETSGTRVTARAGSISINDGKQVVRVDAGNSFVRNTASSSSALLNSGDAGTADTLMHARGLSGGGSDSGNGEGDLGRHCRPCRPPESPIRPCRHHHPYPYGYNNNNDDDRDDDCRCRDDNH